MRKILAAANAELLAQFAWSRVLLAFDFDGTLAPIVTDHDGARMRRRTARLLAKACRLYPCAVITGRDGRDVGARLAGSRVRYVVGNHGQEHDRHDRDIDARLDAATVALRRRLELMAGVEIERKLRSLAVHYRKSRHVGVARRAIADAIVGLEDSLRALPGKRVVDLVPKEAPNKGDALARLRREEGADTAIYVGDDTTDEDVFALDQPGQLLAIRVGRSRSSAARFFLSNQRDIDPLLAELVRLRTKE